LQGRIDSKPRVSLFICRKWPLVLGLRRPDQISASVAESGGIIRINFAETHTARNMLYQQIGHKGRNGQFCQRTSLVGH
jgi:hypothetical protein